MTLYRMSYLINKLNNQSKSYLLIRIHFRSDRNRIFAIRNKLNKPWINPNDSFLNPSDLFVGVYPRSNRGIELIIET